MNKRDKIFVFLWGISFLGLQQLYSQPNVQIALSRAYILHGTDVDLQIDREESIYNGNRMFFNMFEPGPALGSHLEFSPARLNNIPSAQYPYITTDPSHATLVASVGAANGTNRRAKGIAFNSKIRVFSSGLDLPNHDKTGSALSDLLAIEQFDHVLVTNHSYGLEPDIERAYWFGTYNDQAYKVDAIACKYPYWLPVVAAGNSGYDYSNPSPLVFGYDFLMAGLQTAKNTLVVANLLDATIDDDGVFENGSIHRTSSQGPTDDLRIKPEVAAPGCNIYAAGIMPSDPPLEVKDNSYYNFSNGGTSAASPVVSGIGLLLQQVFEDLNHCYMKAATLKGLIIHTADKIGPPINPSQFAKKKWFSTEGPDPNGGYGLINADFAGSAILERGHGSIIDEKVLIQGQYHVVPFPTSDKNKVIVSISWTDPEPGTQAPSIRYNWQLHPAEPNLTTPMLVNDLDVTIKDTYKGAVVNTFHPWKLAIDNNTITTVRGVNNVDNYEQIDFLPQKDHQYSVIVTHKDILRNGHQDYSLIVTGLADDGEKDCQEHVTISQPVAFGVNETATDNISIKNSVLPMAGLTTMIAPEVIMVSGSGVLNSNFYAGNGPCVGHHSFGSKSKTKVATAQSVKPMSISIDGKTAGDSIKHNLDDDLQIYPNPAITGTITIKRPTFLSNISIYSLDNKVLMNESVQGNLNTEFDISRLDKGMYIIRCQATDGRLFAKKILKK